MLLDAAKFFDWLLLLLTAASSLAAVRRYRDWRRLDILFFVLCTFASVFLSGGSVHGLRLLAQVSCPYLLIRLVWHVREVPLVLKALTLATVGAGVAALVLAPPSLVSLVFEVVVGALILYPAGIFVHEARHTRGVTTARLRLAAAGALMLTVTHTEIASFQWIAISARRSPFWLIHLQQDLNGILTLAILGCFYLAFSTPRRLRARWQRTEQARYLSATAERDAEDRGLHAAGDLRQAAERSVSHALVLVALRPEPASSEFAVREVSLPAFADLTRLETDGLVGRLLAAGTFGTGRPDECAPALAARLTPIAASVLVAPIMTSTHVWGVVLVAQRRSSLFPEDDLILLGHLGRYAGTALDHAALVADVRERERRRADRRLREAESRTSLMLDSIKDYAMFVMDDEGYVVTWHVGATHVFDHTSEQMVGEPAAQLYNLSPEEFRARLDEARKAGSAAWEGTCRRRDGGRFVGMTALRPLEGESDLPGFVAVTRDVTERRDLEDRLRQSQKMEAVGQLAGGIAHDFNNLLLAITGYAEWLEQDLRDDPKRHEQIVEIQKSAERAAGLTRQLLAFSRRQMLQPAAINLSRLVSELLPMLRRLIGEHVEVVAEMAPNLVRVLGDRSQVEQVIVNLCVNARDAMPAGGRLTIRTANVELDRAMTGQELVPGPYAILEVSDTGVGMDRATRERIFEPFFTTKEVGKGTGLGLSTVYGIVRQMGGMVRVESEPQRGSTFRLFLPETVQPEARSATEPTGPTPGGSETVLLVEDEAAVRVLLAKTLERHGYRVVSAEHPAAALALAQAHTERFDLVITDVVMPGSVGPEFIRELKRLKGELPVLYISGYADASLAWHGNAPTASHFLQKPFSSNDLLARIRQILAGGGHAATVPAGDGRR